MKRVSRGQAATEYLLILVIILLAILAATPSIKTVILDKLFPAAKDNIQKAADNLKGNLGATP